MKELICKCFIAVCFILLSVPATMAQGNQYDFASAGLTMTIPNDWVAREHILLLMMPKAEDLIIEAEVLTTNDLSEAVELSSFELKSVFPTDTSFVVDDIVINKMPVKKIDKISGPDQLIYYILKTPEDKVVKLHCKAPKKTITKYKNDLAKLIQSIKPKE